eukprot:976099-Amorphochlora_amoeboformis.AAC.1
MYQTSHPPCPHTQHPPPTKTCTQIGESLEISSKFGLADILGVTPPALSSTPLSGTPLSGTPPMGTPPGGAPGGVSIGRRKRRGKGTMSRTAVLSSM